MGWIFWTILVAACVVWIYLKMRGELGEKEAVELLRGGAKVLDVRSAGEYSRGHLEGGINVPLGGLSEGLPGLIPDKDTVVLIHCLHGGRSAIAKARLKALGYPNAHDIGSLERAKRILEKSGRDDAGSARA